MKTSTEILNEITEGLKAENAYIDQYCLDSLVKEAIDYYNYAGWAKSLFIDNQTHFLKYHVKLSIARQYAYKFYDFVIAQRKEQNLFIY